MSTPSGQSANPQATQSPAWERLIRFPTKGAGTVPALWGEVGGVGFQGVRVQLVDGEQKYGDVFFRKYVTITVSFR